MKNTFNFIFFICVFPLTLGSCKKDKNKQAGISDNTSKMGGMRTWQRIESGYKKGTSSVGTDSAIYYYDSTLVRTEIEIVNDSSVILDNIWLTLFKIDEPNNVWWYKFDTRHALTPRPIDAWLDYSGNDNKITFEYDFTKINSSGSVRMYSL